MGKKDQDQELLKRISDLESEFENFKDGLASAVNALGEAVKQNVEQMWSNQEIMADHLQLIDKQVVILIDILESYGVSVPTPGDEIDAESNQPETQA